MINNKLYKSLDFGAPYFQKKMTQIGSASIVMGFRCLDTGAGGEPNVGCKAQGWSGPAVQRSSRSCRSGMLPTQKAFFPRKERDLQMAPLACWRSCPGAMVCLHVSP